VHHYVMMDGWPLQVGIYACMHISHSPQTCRRGTYAPYTSILYALKYGWTHTIEE
jgi:hypothetical protein